MNLQQKKIYVLSTIQTRAETEMRLEKKDEQSKKLVK